MSFKTVQMLVHLQGGRGDGRDWPPYLGTIDVTEGEAEELISGGLAQVPGSGDEEEIEDTEHLRWEDAAEKGDIDNDFDPDDDFDNDESALEVKRKPYETESRAKWIAYAISRGMIPEEANKSTKNSLVRKYKEL